MARAGAATMIMIMPYGDRNWEAMCTQIQIHGFVELGIPSSKKSWIRSCAKEGLKIEVKKAEGGKVMCYPLRSNACATQRALYKFTIV
uniref:Uncharacterized protein n=1 Tax=Oryza glumipatula TaxID=40148 RepID=A0A0E0AGK9_9ORYZ